MSARYLEVHEYLRVGFFKDPSKAITMVPLLVTLLVSTHEPPSNLLTSQLSRRYKHIYSGHVLGLSWGINPWVASL